MFVVTDPPRSQEPGAPLIVVLAASALEGEALWNVGSYSLSLSLSLCSSLCSPLFLLPLASLALLCVSLFSALLCSFLSPSLNCTWPSTSLSHQLSPSGPHRSQQDYAGCEGVQPPAKGRFAGSFPQAPCADYCGTAPQAAEGRKQRSHRLGDRERERVQILTHFVSLAGRSWGARFQVLQICDSRHEPQHQELQLLRYQGTITP